MAFNSHYKLAPAVHPGVTDPHTHFHSLTCQLPHIYFNLFRFDHQFDQKEVMSEGGPGAWFQEIKGELMVRESLRAHQCKGKKTRFGQNIKKG